MLLNEQDVSQLTVKKAKAHSSVAVIDAALRTVNNPVFTEIAPKNPLECATKERSTLLVRYNLATHSRTSSKK